ncbi:MAG TPA: cation:proton antiporter [Candidatus Binatia bacterium]|jgi:NhaP-type Na+/H+ or K+/H+ antiporter
MEFFSAQFFILTLALVGVVIIVAALLSGLIDRSDVPQVGVFLALGAMLGPAGLQLLDVSLDSPVLRVVATLALVLVLFTDAVGLSVAEVRRHRLLAALVLGPGTLLSAVLIALAAWWLLDFPPASAAMIGAALASTDPVMLRGLLRRPGLPEPVRLALRLESGLNDVVLLPIILVGMAILSEQHLAGIDSARLGLELFLLGPGAGVAVGLLAIGALELVRRKTGVRRDYESLYSLGVAFAAYAAAEAVHGSGYLAAFSAGLTIAALDVELCDCFHEYGQTTAEMTLLFTFILFGSSLIWRGLLEINATTLFFALVTLLIRPIVFFLSLARTDLDRRSRLLIAWFGPRGLGSLLLILVPVFAGVPGTEPLFVICCLVVLLSVALHGGSLMFLARKACPAVPMTVNLTAASPSAAKDGDAQSPAAGDSDDRMTVEEFRRLGLSGAPVLVVDARSEASFGASAYQAQGALRIPPDQALRRIAELNVPRHTWIAVFCA